MSYKHLTLQERYLINAYKSIKTQKEIAKMIGVHPSTICRELKRGRGKIDKGYWVIKSHQRAVKLQREKSHNANFKLTEENSKFIEYSNILGNFYRSIDKVNFCMHLQM